MWTWLVEIVWKTKTIMPCLKMLNLLASFCFLQVSGQVEGILKNPDDFFINPAGIVFKRLPSGEFFMGSENGGEDRKPVHKVKMTKGVFIQVRAVTWLDFIIYGQPFPKEIGLFEASFIPVGIQNYDELPGISWNDANQFCHLLSQSEGFAYRLPTEAEWEYACRAGTKSEYFWGDERDFSFMKAFNPWGYFHFPYGVHQFCSDYYGAYSPDQQENPTGPENGSERVLRGGTSVGFGHGGASPISSSARMKIAPGYRSCYWLLRLGFRMALEKGSNENPPRDSSGN